MQRSDVVSQSPDVVSGSLVFTSTRVPVQILVDYLKAGDSLDRFLEGFPSVTRAQAEAFLDEATHALRSASPGQTVHVPSSAAR